MFKKFKSHELSLFCFRLQTNETIAKTSNLPDSTVEQTNVADPDPAFHSDAHPDPDPTFQFDADPNPRIRVKGRFRILPLTFFQIWTL